MKSTLIALAAAGMLVSTAGIAQPYHRDDPQRWSQNDRWDDRSASINERESRINAHIQRGMDSGRIDDREARRLIRELRDVEAKERAFKDDGRLSRRETQTLSRDLDRLTDNVRRQIRDYGGAHAHWSHSRR
jgi:hypothetical protein